MESGDRCDVPEYFSASALQLFCSFRGFHERVTVERSQLLPSRWVDFADLGWSVRRIRIRNRIDALDRGIGGGEQTSHARGIDGVASTTANERLRGRAVPLLPCAKTQLHAGHVEGTSGGRRHEGECIVRVVEIVNAVHGAMIP